MTNLPAAYTNAQRALARAVKIEQAVHVSRIAEGMEVLAIKAKDGTLAGDAAEIKIRATRKIGVLIRVERDADKLAKGGRPKKTGLSFNPQTLSERGVDKNLAHRARSLEALPERSFEKEIDKARRLASAAAEGDREIIKEARAERTQAKRERRQRRVQELADKIEALPERKFGVVLADPEWQFETWSDDGKDRAPENHYPTSDLQEIKDRDVPSICADDCVLFLWATVPLLDQAMVVMDAWGFNYVSQFVWVKDKAGTGYWNRNRHELLLVGTRGSVPAPAPGTQFELGDRGTARQA